MMSYFNDDLKYLLNSLKHFSDKGYMVLKGNHYQKPREARV